MSVVAGQRERRDHERERNPDRARHEVPLDARPPQPLLAEKLSAQLKLSPLLTQCLLNRGLSEPAAIENFLQPASNTSLILFFCRTWIKPSPG